MVQTARLNRWVILACYALLAACTQLLWLTFAAIDTDTARVLHTDTGTVGDLAAIFPLVYVVLALPAGRWLDSHFVPALAAGALLTAAGGLLRLIDTSSLLWQFIGQLVIACGQPFVLNAITKIAARHFPKRERAAAISVGSIALFAGILAAVLAAGPLFSAGGLRLMLVVEMVPTVAAAALVLATLRTRPAYADNPSVSVNLRWLAHDRFMWLLAALIFVGMGTYNAIATWLQPVLNNFGNGGAAGGLIAVMTVAGIVGAALLPSFVAARDRRRPMILFALAVSVAAFAAMDLRHDTVWLGAWLFVAGFLLMACLPVVLDWSEVHAGAERSGSAAGFLLMAGNLGGVLLVLLVQAVMGAAYLPFAALAIVSLLAVPLAARLPDRGRTELFTGAAPAIEVSGSAH